MFKANGNRINISRGDTGILTFVASGAELTENDRAVFTIRRRNGGVVMEKIAVPEENKVRIPFTNEETQALREGTMNGISDMRWMRCWTATGV